jgi:hypothetical protein
MAKFEITRVEIVEVPDHVVEMIRAVYSRCRQDNVIPPAAAFIHFFRKEYNLGICAGKELYDAICREACEPESIGSLLKKQIQQESQNN